VKLKLITKLFAALLELWRSIAYTIAGLAKSLCGS
jgi:hypothetical protein